MKKSQKAMLAVLTATVTAGSMFALTACQKPLKDEPLKGDALAVFSDGASDAFFESDGWCNGDVFNVTWSSENVTYADGAAKLSISDASATATVPYLGGELRSYQHFSYGDFSVRMKPAKVVGTASTFFTYTGPTEETDGEPNPHDEIDIEFLGADTTHVQFNYFVNGQGGHEFMYDLGFDASLEYHDYGFRWTEDYITWFVDGKPVHKVTASESNPIPSTPGRLLMNHWCGTENAEGWMGKYEGSDGKTADYASVSTTAEPIDDIPEIPDVPVGDIDWSELDAQPLEFTSSNGKHTATTEGTVTTVVYDGIGNDYSNINATVTDIAAEKNWVHLTLRNNATDGSTPIVRINVLGDGDKNLNASATMNGKPVQTDLQWGGSYFNNIPAGEDIEAVIYYKGVAKTLQLMLDSTRTGSETYSGNITISEIKFAKYGEIEMPEEPPVEENSSVMIGENEVSFAGAGYTVSSSDDKSSMTVTYDGIKGNSYNTVTASVSEFVGDNNTFTVTITNNGAATAKIRMDIKCPKEHANAGNENNDFCNISAIYDGETVADGNDYQYGGADWVQIAAGATVTVKITFTANVATDITFFIDSSTHDDKTSHSGEIVFSAMTLSKDGGNDPVNPPEGGDDIPDIPSEGWEKIADNFDGWEKFTLERFAYGYFDGIRVISKNTPINYLDNCGWTLAKSYTFVKFSLKNELGEAASVRIDFVRNGVDDSSSVEAVSVNGRSIAVDEVNRAAIISLGAYEFADVVIKLDPEKQVDLMVVYINSINESGNPREGRLVFSDLKGVVNTAYSEAETPIAIPENGWSDIPTDMFANWTGYETFENNDGNITIAHTSAKSDFACVGMEFDKNYDWIAFAVKNNGNTTAKLRIDVKKEGDENPSLVTGAYPARYASVISSLSAASVIIPAGETVHVVLKVNGSVYFDRLVVFFDSCADGDNSVTGSITVSGLRGIVNEDVKHAEIGKAESKQLAFVRSNGDYNVSPESAPVDSVTVSYNNINYGSFSYIRSEIESFAAQYNTLTFKVKNNGANEMQLRIGISTEKYYDGSRENINVCNISCSPDQTTYQDNRGGSYVAVGSGQEKTFVLKYDPNKDGGPKQLIIYFDSCKKDGNEQRSGNATIGEFTFSNT